MKMFEEDEWYFVSREHVVCADGFTISIQASSGHYSVPRGKAEMYRSCELGFPSEADDLIKEYAEDDTDYTQTVYPYVPAKVIRLLIAKHGGMSQGECPPLDINYGTYIGWERVCGGMVYEEE